MANTSCSLNIHCIFSTKERAPMYLLLSLPTTVPIAKAIQLVKAGSLAWIHQTFQQLHNFSWQQGYGASVSASRNCQKPFMTSKISIIGPEFFNRKTWRF